VRNCARDEGRSLEAGRQGQASYQFERSETLSLGRKPPL
jgi:hypothetical protein